MYAGAGAAPMLAAAAAWNGIAVELNTAASSVESVVMRLGAEHWMGPASLSMAAAAQPYLVWLTYTAESSALAAAQAMASAAAFETAFAMTIPPAEVAANRALLAELIADNVLGHNMPAIAATEARYGEMWAQDASAMYGYAASSAIAGRLSPLTRPSQLTNPAGIASQAAAVGQAAESGSAQQVMLSSLITDAPDAVMNLASPADATAVDVVGLLAALDAMDSPHFETANHLKAVWADFGAGFMGMSAADQDDTVAEGAASGAAVSAAAGVVETPPLVQVGSASSVGGLSVPASWPSAAPVLTPNTALEGTAWAVPEEDESDEAIALAPGMFASDDGAGPGAGPRYGVKPTVMPKRGLF